MYGDHLVACGTVWAQFGEIQAGLELVRALDSTDETVRVLARTLLQQADRGSKELIGEALAEGQISAVSANAYGFEPNAKWEIESLTPKPWSAELT